MFKLKICAVNVCTQECNIGIVFAYVLFNVLLLNHICILFTDSILYDFSFKMLHTCHPICNKSITLYSLFKYSTFLERSDFNFFF